MKRLLGIFSTTGVVTMILVLVLTTFASPQLVWAQSLSALEDRVKQMEQDLSKLQRELAKQREEAKKPVRQVRDVGKRVEELEKAAKQPLGAEFSLTIGASTGPFKTDTGFSIAATVDLPLLRDPLFGQKLMGDVMLGWSRTTDDNRTSTSVLAGVKTTAFPEGIPASAVTSTKLDVTVLQVVPGFKYKLDRLGEPESFLRKVQPYVVVGVGFNVVLDQTEGAPLGSLIGGAAPTPAALAGLGLPIGQGDVLIGGNFGGGIDFQLTDKIFLGAEARTNVIKGDNRNFTTFGARVGFRF